MLARWLCVALFALTLKSSCAKASNAAVLNVDSRGISSVAASQRLMRRQVKDGALEREHPMQSSSKSDDSNMMQVMDDGAVHEGGDSDANQGAKLELSDHPSEDHCKVKGVFKDAHGEAKFHIDDSFLELSIDGLPIIFQSFEKDTRASKISIGNVTTRGHEAPSQQYIRHANALATSKFAAKSARKLSRLLHSHGYDGSSAICTFSFHMLMLNLHMASRKGYGIAPSLAALSEKDHDNNRENHLPYGYESQCPLTHHRTWKCRKEWGWRRRWGDQGSWVNANADYVAKTGYRRRFNRRRRNVDPDDPLEGSGGNLKCTDSGFSGRLIPGNCAGLCGAKCDCWESICGNNYRCNYNPICCSHDLACDHGGYLCGPCLNVGAVYNACKNDGLPTYDGR